MKTIGSRTYRGIIITPVLGGWIHGIVGFDKTGNFYRYPMFTKSLEAAKAAIAVEIKSGRYEAIDGMLTKVSA